ncbi:Syntenin-1 [Amphibalanus amphitrite]|uniref:Syntenin-1 n=1 Tax=Amphibalanus amphitrite TaxID=1232801 RepID=A0A6A4X6S3_AMPAM|nr:Syntenin-1 [Amphibalanus amphitrite]
MSQLYPSLEDMKVDQMVRAEQAAAGAPPAPEGLPYPVRPLMPVAPGQEQFAHLYPSLTDYMGLELTPELVAQLEEQEKQLVQQQSSVVPSASSSGGYQLVAPISGQSGTLQKAAVSHAIREAQCGPDPPNVYKMTTEAEPAPGPAPAAETAEVNGHVTAETAVEQGEVKKTVVEVHDEQTNGHISGRSQSVADAQMGSGRPWFRRGGRAMPLRKSVTYGKSVEELAVQRRQMAAAAMPQPWMQRLVTLCKDRDGKVGLRCQEINKGVFVVLVQKNSPAAMAGLRFGDQILQINDESVAGYDMDKVHSIFRKARSDAIKFGEVGVKRGRGTSRCSVHGANHDLLTAPPVQLPQ